MPNSQSTVSPQHVDDAVKQALTERRIKELEEKIESLAKDRDQALRWGVIVLGSAVVGLVTWVFNLITRHT